MTTLLLCLLLAGGDDSLRPTVAIMPPIPTGDAESWVGYAVADNLTERLLFHSRYDPRTVTRIYPLNVFGWRQVLSAARAEGIDSSKPLSKGDVERLRKQLGADCIFSGSYQTGGKAAVLSWSLLGKGGGGRQGFDLGGFGALTEVLARDILVKIGQGTKALETHKTADLPVAAMRPYAQALEILATQSLDPRARLVLPRAEIQRAHLLLTAATDARADFARAWVARGVASAMAGDMRAAEEELVNAMANAGEFDPDTSLGLYYVYDRQGDTKKALQILEEATTTHLGFLQALGYLGQTYARDSQSHEALRVFATYQARVPNSPWARMKRAEALARVGNHDQAIVETETVLKEHPGSIMVLTALASRQIDACRYDDARATIERGLALHPNHPALLTRSSYVALEQKNTDEALRLAEKAVAALGDGRGESLAGYAHLNLAHALALLGRNVEAWRALVKAKELGVDAEQLVMLRRDSRLKEFLTDPRNPFPFPQAEPAK